MFKKKLKSLSCLAIALCLFATFCPTNIFALSKNAPNYTDNLLAGVKPTANMALKDVIYCTDGSKDVFKNTNDGGKDVQNKDALWLQFDLGNSHDLGRISMWHYFDDARTYYDVIVQLSNDSKFENGVTTVFNNDTDNSLSRDIGTDAEYAESATGKIIDFDVVSARYIRLYSRGSMVNEWNHYVEVEAYAPYEAVKPKPTTFLPNAQQHLETPTPDKFGQITQPDVVYIPEGLNGYKYYMVTTSFANNQGSAENPYILVSNDGINWEQHTGNLLPDPVNSSWYQDPDILYYKGELRVYYYNEAGKGAGNNGWVKMLKSKDGKNWTEQKNPIYTSNDYKYGAFGASVTAKDDKYTLWSVNAHNEGYCGTNNRVEYRISNNGIDGWSDKVDITSQVVPSGYQPWHLNVEYIPEKQEYWMLLAAYPSANPNSNNCELFFAKSKDGKKWSLYPKAVLKASKDSTAWDSGCVYRSTFVYDAEADMLRVWYGARKELVWHVGYTEAVYSELVFEPEQKEVLVTDKSTYESNEKITVNYSGATGDSWVGIYPKGATPGSDQPAALDWTYTKSIAQPDGSIVFDPNDTLYSDSKAWGKAGEYEVILFANGGYTIEARKPFKIVKYLSTNKGVYELKEKITVDYSGATGDSWIGIYPKGATPGSDQPAALDWTYTKSIAQPDGSIVFDPNNTLYSNSEAWGKAGEYEAILFANGGYTIVSRKPFSIRQSGVVSGKPASVVYNRTATKRGRADGTITISPASNESGLSRYVLYWGNNTGKLAEYTQIASLNKTGNEITYSVVKNTIIPTGATKIMAYAANENIESTEFAEVAINLNDVMPVETPIYKFQVMSDIHVDKDDKHIHNKHFDNALKDIKATASDSSGVFIVGDNTNNGRPEDYDKVNAIIQANKTGLPPIYHAMGNHDFYNGATIELFKKKTGMSSHYYSKTINSQKFIVLGSDNTSGNGNYANIYATQMEWLESELSNAPKNQPTYIFLHQPLKDTVAGSLPGQGWEGVEQDAELRAVLKRYPNSILFTGHTHWELDSKSVMYDGNSEDATMFNDASCGYLWTDTSEDSSLGKVGSQGFYVEVYKNKVVVRGRDFVNNKWVSAAQFLVSSSKEDFAKLKLDAKIAQANEILKQANTYTKETLANFETMLVKANHVSEDIDAKQGDIDKAILDLRISIFELRKIPDKSKIEELLKQSSK